MKLGRAHSGHSLCGVRAHLLSGRGVQGSATQPAHSHPRSRIFLLDPFAGHAHLVGSTDMLLFATPIYFAFCGRSNPPAHKRLILIATITLLDAAFVRWPIRAACGICRWRSYAATHCFRCSWATTWCALEEFTASGQCVPDLAPAGTNSNWANRPLAELRNLGAGYGPFFPLKRRNNRHARFAGQQTLNIVILQRISWFR